MKPPRFIYHDPATVEEALGLLALHGDAARILAGGQSLMPMLNFRLARPDHVIDINRLAALATVIPGPDAGLRIGALVRQRTLERSELIRERCPMITQAMPFVGRPQIRYLPEQVIGEAGRASRHVERRHAGCPSIEGGGGQTVSIADSHHPPEERDGARSEEFGLDGVSDVRVALPTDPVPQKVVTAKLPERRRKVVLLRHDSVWARIDALIRHEESHSTRARQAFMRARVDWEGSPPAMVPIAAAVWSRVGSSTSSLTPPRVRSQPRARSRAL